MLVLATRRLAPARPLRSREWQESKLLRLEPVTTRDIACFPPGHQPTRALPRGAMGDRVRNDIPLGLPLQSIVTERRSGRHRCFHIPRLNKLPFLLGTVCPDAGEAVRLQFYADL